ncbi:MAG: uracil-DNA glycosylase family protein [Thermoanaerobaculia bacterium]
MPEIPPLIALSRRLADAAGELTFAPPVAFVYNPLVYAREPLELYLERWGCGPKEHLFVGMNPGPFGMMQTGVPFGEVGMVRDWLGIHGRVSRPTEEHPKRPVEGFACRRSEVSGARLWGWARARFGGPQAFFARAFVWNWCPLGFLDAGGRNLTPDKLPRAERAALATVCDRALAGVVEILSVRQVIAVGAVAEAAVHRALAVGEATGGSRESVVILRIPHPSPASPAANRDWAGQVDTALAAAGVKLGGAGDVSSRRSRATADIR